MLRFENIGHNLNTNFREFIEEYSNVAWEKKIWIQRKTKYFNNDVFKLHFLY